MSVFFLLFIRFLALEEKKQWLIHDKLTQRVRQLGVCLLLPLEVKPRGIFIHELDFLIVLHDHDWFLKRVEHGSVPCIFKLLHLDHFFVQPFEIVGHRDEVHRQCYEGGYHKSDHDFEGSSLEIRNLDALGDSVDVAED